MLIVNDNQLHLAGVTSLEERCCHRSRPLAAYPLLICDDTRQTVYYVTCALGLATDLLVDLATFFHPPAPILRCLCLRTCRRLCLMMTQGEERKEELMQWSTDVKQIKAAIWQQAFLGNASATCPIGCVVGIRRRKGQLLALVRGWGRWFPVDDVFIVAAPCL